VLFFLIIPERRYLGLLHVILAPMSVHSSRAAGDGLTRNVGGLPKNVTGTDGVNNSPKKPIYTMKLESCSYFQLYVSALPLDRCVLLHIMFTLMSVHCSQAAGMV
jgi:hypothetical protein